MSRVQAPPGVLEIVATLERAGHETWCVGGAVRDVLMGRPQLDWDIATAALPSEVQRLFRRTVPVGVEFGTVGVLDRSGRMHEVTTFRRDVETDGRHAVVRFGASLDDDLARRDFTINAIAYSPSRDRIHDPFDGQGDIARRVLQTVGDPVERMREDRLRALRAIRFATRFGFTIEPATWDAIRGSAPHLGRLSPERVRQELEKTMDQVPRPSAAMRLWQESGAFAALIPELSHASPLMWQTLDYLAIPGPPGRPRRRLDRVAALFLPVPFDQLPGVLRRLRFSNQQVALLSDAVRLHQTLSPEVEKSFDNDGRPSARQGRQWASRTRRLGFAPFLRLSYAVWCARRAAGQRAPDPAAVRSAYRTLGRAAFRDPVDVGDLAVDGEDLIRAGIAPGPRIGIILRALLDLVLEDPTRNDRSGLMEAAAALAPRLSDPREDS